MWTVTKEFSFEAAHSLPFLPPTHKCHHIHGHSYKVVVICESKELQLNRFWVVDYAEISTAMEPLIKIVDHSNLNRVITVPTTSENLAKWFYIRLKKSLPVTAVEVHETLTTKAIYRP